LIKNETASLGPQNGKWLKRASFIGNEVRGWGSGDSRRLETEVGEWGSGDSRTRLSLTRGGAGSAPLLV